MTFLKKDDIILFQGDSITDCGREYGDNNLGFGYVALITAHLQANYPEMNFTIYNRGISGNRVVDLVERWDRDCIDLEPDVLSILIGINDCWRKFDANEETTASQYKEGYRSIIERAKEANPNLRLIMLEPFVLPVPEDRKEWRDDLDKKIIAAREVAAEFGALYIPLDGIFAAKCALRQPEFWAQDGVHPTIEGSGVIAKAWLDTVGF